MAFGDRDSYLFIAFSAMLFILYCSNFVLSGSDELFSLIVANTLITKTYVWNVISSCFFEKNFFKLIVDFLLLFQTCKHIKNPSVEQFGLYLLFNILACTLGTSFICFINFGIFGSDSSLLSSHNGFGGVLVSLLMFCRQSVGDIPVLDFVPSINFHYISPLYVGFHCILSSLGLKCFSNDLSFVLISLFFSWSYLRFHYKYNESQQCGEKSEEFSFVAMFPEVFLSI
jgi:hypothetical protein